jgi:hypothetical protein
MKSQKQKGNRVKATQVSKLGGIGGNRVGTNKKGAVDSVERPVEESATYRSQGSKRQRVTTSVTERAEPCRDESVGFVQVDSSRKRKLAEVEQQMREEEDISDPIKSVDDDKVIFTEQFHKKVKCLWQRWSELQSEFCGLVCPQGVYPRTAISRMYVELMLSRVKGVTRGMSRKFETMLKIQEELVRIYFPVLQRVAVLLGVREELIFHETCVLFFLNFARIRLIAKADVVRYMREVEIITDFYLVLEKDGASETAENSRKQQEAWD